MLGSIQRTGCAKLFYMCDYAQVIMTLFFDCFCNILSFFENCSAKPGFLFSIEITGSSNLFCINDYAQFFVTKSYDSRKCKVCDMLTVFWTFLDNYTAKRNIIGLIDTTGC